MTLSPEVKNGVVYIHWQRHGPPDMWVYCYRYTNELPVGLYCEGSRSNPAKRLLMTQAENGVVEDGAIEKGKTGYYAFELKDPGDIVIRQREALTWDFKTLAVYVPVRKSDEEQTREQIESVMSSSASLYAKLKALDDRERKLFKEIDESDKLPSEKEREKEVVRRLTRNDWERLMNVTAQKNKKKQD